MAIPIQQAVSDRGRALIYEKIHFGDKVDFFILINHCKFDLIQTHHLYFIIQHGNGAMISLLIQSRHGNAFVLKALSSPSSIDRHWLNEIKHNWISFSNIMHHLGKCVTCEHENIVVNCLKQAILTRHSVKFLNAIDALWRAINMKNEIETSLLKQNFGDFLSRFI